MLDKEHAQQRFQRSATDANQHWFKEYMALTNTAGNTGRVTPANNFRSDIQSLLGRQHGIQPRSHVTDSTLRFGSINCLDELFL